MLGFVPRGLKFILNNNIKIELASIEGLLYANALLKAFSQIHAFNPQNPVQWILPIRKLRLRKDKLLTHNHTASKKK